jgi:Arc/MetJ family transcription regulator
MSTNANVSLRRTIPLPANREELLAKKTMKSMTLNDYVDAIHVELFGVDEKYTRFLHAAWNSEAVEGALDIDDTMAAQIIKQYAIEKKIAYVMDSNLATIRHSLKVVLNRYHMSRKERAYTVAGEIIPDGDEDHA